MADLPKKFETWLSVHHRLKESLMLSENGLYLTRKSRLTSWAKNNSHALLKSNFLAIRNLTALPHVTGPRRCFTRSLFTASRNCCTTCTKYAHHRIKVFKMLSNTKSLLSVILKNTARDALSVWWQWSYHVQAKIDMDNTWKQWSWYLQNHYLN